MLQDGPWLIISDIARRLGRSDSTVRKWGEVYGDLVPARRVGPRSLAYPLTWFMDIARMADERRTRREIRTALAERQANPTGEPHRPPATVDEIYDVLAEIRDLLKQVVDRLPSA